MKIYSFTRKIDYTTEFYLNKAAAQLALIKEATIGLRSLPADELKDAFSLVGKMGYGKKASIGKGRFEVGEFCEIESFFNENSNAFMTLGPSSLENFSEIYYEPFTRFGKHGASLASDKPFKSPVLLAQSGALIVPNDDEKTKIQKAAYIGKGIKGHSSHEESVQQGYAIVVGTKVIK